jgi:YesN/AraC family two-component response regulator
MVSLLPATTKAIGGPKVKVNWAELSSYQQLMELIDIFPAACAIRTDTEILNSGETSKAFILKDKIRMGAIYEYIDANYHQKPDVNVVAAKVNLTTAAFCRYFKKQTNITFTDFVNQYRIDTCQKPADAGQEHHRNLLRHRV